jgi:hypothetical protein
MQKKMSKEEAKRDIRNKIMMGDLIIRAGLDEYFFQDKAIILGILLDAKSKIVNNQFPEQLTEHYKMLGRPILDNKLL